ncbi:MAG: right-handed parallel beta-helix repeat-containing protein [Anaerolineaceae bacterium]
MKKHLSLSSLLPVAVLIALIMAAINPAVVFAEGEAPETAPEETPPTETLMQGNEVQDVVGQLADNQAAIVDQNGSAIPLASQTALDALTDPDPWFYCSILCIGGRSPFYGSIKDALDEWYMRNGTGMIYLEGGFNQTENVILSGITDGLASLRGIVWDTTTAGAKPVLTGTIIIENFLTGFKIDGVTVIANSEYGISMQNNAGAIVLNNVDVKNSSGDGIRVVSHWGTISLNQVNSSNYGNGALLNNCNWNGTACTFTAGITVTNSKFIGNGENGVKLGDGLDVFSKGTILINGVSSYGNNGEGLGILAFGNTATIKNSVFSNNVYDPDRNAFGHGIYVYPESKANLNLDNVYLVNNTTRGAIISTLGNVILRNVVVIGNGQEGIIITKDSSTYDNGAKKVTVIGSNFKDNGQTNLDIYASGSVIITNLISTRSVNGSGLQVNNTGALTPLPVSLSKVVLTGNKDKGGIIFSRGTITVNGITASQNVGAGLYLDNSFTGATGNIIMLGTLGANQINNNNSGLNIFSDRNITISFLQANENGFEGIYIEGKGPSSNVILTGVESSYNDALGVSIPTTGTVTINKVTASHNGDVGMFIGNDSATTAKSVLISNSTFNDNTAENAYGLAINSVGFISLNNVNASGNNSYGVYLYNAQTTLPTQVLQAVTVINSTFDNSINGDGLFIQSQRKITLSNINASGNANAGVVADNTFSTISSPIVISGVNRISYNGANGIFLVSNGPLTASGINAIGNLLNEVISDSLVTITNSQFSANGLLGMNITANGNTVLRGVTAVHNGTNNGSSSGIVVDLASGRLYIYTSVLMANSGFGLYAYVVNPSTDVYLAPTNIILGNDAKDPYDEGDIQIKTR